MQLFHLKIFVCCVPCLWFHPKSLIIVCTISLSYLLLSFFSITKIPCFLTDILFSISSSLQSDLMSYWIFCANAQVSIANIRCQCTLLVLALLNKQLFLRADNSIKFQAIITDYLWIMFCQSFLEI